MEFQSLELTVALLVPEETIERSRGWLGTRALSLSMLKTQQERGPPGCAPLESLNPSLWDADKNAAEACLTVLSMRHPFS